MDIYCLDIIWILLSVIFLVLCLTENAMKNLGPKISELYNYLLTFGKTKTKNYFLDVPKSWFLHFYILACCWSTWLFARWFIFRNLSQAEKDIVYYARMSLYKNNNLDIYSSTDNYSIPIGGLLLLIHFYQRCFESACISRSNGKMSILAYILGLVFYFMVPIQYILSEENFTVDVSVSIFAFSALISTYFQHISIRSMAELRGSPISPKYSCPKSTGVFKYIMSPQYLFEIMFYLFLIPVVGNHMFFPFLFTLINQSVSAKLTLIFYQDKFPEELKNRKALIPFIY